MGDNTKVTRSVRRRHREKRENESCNEERRERNKNYQDKKCSETNGNQFSFDFNTFLTYLIKITTIFFLLQSKIALDIPFLPVLINMNIHLLIFANYLLNYRRSDIKA